MNILGISAFYHDSAAAFVQDGVIVAAAQEERFTRRKHDASFPDKRRRLLFTRSGHNSGRFERCGLLRKASGQGRSSYRNLSRRRAQRTQVVFDGHTDVVA